MGCSIDHAPVVGMVPGELLEGRQAGEKEGPAEGISAGYGGYGMVNAFLCSKALALMILGRDEEVELPTSYVLTAQRARALRMKLRDARCSSGEHMRSFL